MVRSSYHESLAVLHHSESIHRSMDEVAAGVFFWGPESQAPDPRAQETLALVCLEE